ncbi:helix-turn-helix transcriptional regulator [Brevundimonas sp.]|uniref:AraC family transcriptional regulator n=1 Tax=Brevundimonas sp. TaxID=1871086 RepID=UPI0028A97A59|nr:helix-turn-helix transcriptional regulator [Brevundimonas sp.]
MTSDAQKPPSTPLGMQRLSSSDLSWNEKMPVVRELYARDLMRVDLQPTASDRAFEFDVWVKPFEGVSWARSIATPVTMLRTGEFLSDGDDDVYIATSSNGATIQLSDRDLDVSANDYFLVSKARAHRLVNHGSATSVLLQTKHADLARLLPGLEEAPVHVFSRNTPGLDLLFGYANAAVHSDVSSASVNILAARQLNELFASVLGAAPELTLTTRRAATLHAIKKSVAEQADNPDLRLTDLAFAHGVSPRYIQRLFEEAGESYSDYVRSTRLERARQLLRAQPTATVLQIALDSGFGDLTTFNRAFRRAFDMTPSEVRQAVRDVNGD